VVIAPIRMKYRGIMFASTLEADWAATFDHYDMFWQYEPQGFRIGDDTEYRPDFYLKTQRTWAEVKGPMDERIDKPRAFQAALDGLVDDEWGFTRELVIILRPNRAGTCDWEGTTPAQDIVIVLCPNCGHFGFMDYTGPWRCRRYCTNKTNKFWNEPGGDIFWPGELPFTQAPRPSRRRAA
jgi:hypothetical protein